MSHAQNVDKNSHLVLVDGSGYIFRAYHALPSLTRRTDGLVIGAVAGFCNMLFKLLREQTGDACPTHFAVIFDAKGKTFRSDIYPGYKAHRPPPPEDLIPQFPLTREATKAFGALAIEQDGFEADDIIATYTAQAAARGARVSIVSSDKDLMQLVSNRVNMVDTMKNRTFGPAEVFGKFGVGPEKVIDIQSLAGDSVDNVPGVPGIGIKTAALLINEFGDLDRLLAHAEKIPQKRRREILLEHADAARVSRALVTLRQDMNLDIPLEDLAIQDPDPQTLLDFLEKMTFRTLTTRVMAAIGEGATDSLRREQAVDSLIPGIPVFDKSKYECVQDEDRLNHWIARCTETGVCAVDLETDSLDSAAANLVGVCLAVADNEACYIPLGHTGGGDLLGEGAPKQIQMQTALKILAPMLHDRAVLKVGQNFKYDLGVFMRHDLYPEPYDDTMLMSYALSCGLHGHGMDTLSEMIFGHKPISFRELAGSGRTQKVFNELTLEDATPYAAEDADVTLRLWKHFKPLLSRESATTVYETLERGMARVLADMENNGIRIDKAALARLSADFEQKKTGLEAEAHELAGKTFNLASPKQLGEILFDDMGLPGGRKTRTGAWQTGANVLEDLAAEHALPKTVLDWRHYAKLKSTYTDTLPLEINPATGRIHTSYGLASTSTGRLSSNDPNLQNIPVRTGDGRQIRTAFVAEPGHVLVAADYSQIELRILAHVADLKSMKQAFTDGIDIHAMTASEMFDVPVKGMDPITRRRAKAINFGIIYGISPYGLANNLGISRSEAGDYIDSYFVKFSGIRDYMETTKEFARSHGYVETIFGRKCHVRGIRGGNYTTRGFAERQAINAPIQGSAADILRRAMLRMRDAIVPIEGAKMLLQVHDELVFEVPENHASALMECARSVMQGACKPALGLSVPLVVDARAATNWNDAH